MSNSKQQCAAPDCRQPFVERNSAQRYCSPQCRYRHYRQRIRAERVVLGRCPQCGSTMDRITGHCSKCQDYWHDKYEASKGVVDVGRLSIGQRMRKAKSPEVKLEVALAWTENWKADQEQLIRDLEKAIRTNDYDLMCIATGQLKAVTQKRFEAMPGVIRRLLEHDPPKEE